MTPLFFLCSHQLVMDLFSQSESASENGDSPPSSPSVHPSHQYRAFPTSTPTRRRSSPGLRRTQSYQDGLNASPNYHANFHSRRPSRFDLCRTETSRLTSWSEFTVRKTLVRFRTRKTAIKRQMRRLSGQRHIPSETIKSVLDHGYEVCKSPEASFTSRLIAVFYCWFYSWIMDVYSHFTDEGTKRSFFKWMLATILVTSGAILVVGLGSFALHQVNFLILLLLNAGVQYLTFLLIFTISVLGTLAIVNYD